MKKCTLRTMALYIFGLSVMTVANGQCVDNAAKFIPEGESLNKACTYWDKRSYCDIGGVPGKEAAVAHVRRECPNMCCPNACDTCATPPTDPPIDSNTGCVDNTEKFVPDGLTENKKVCRFWELRNYCLWGGVNGLMGTGSSAQDVKYATIAHMRQECPVTCCAEGCATCGDCVDITTKFTVSTANAPKMCSWWAKRSYCETGGDMDEAEVAIVRNLCPKSCKICDGGSAPTSPTGPAPTPTGPAPTPTAPCANIKKNNWCNNRKDDCDNPSVSAQCAKTCGKCDQTPTAAPKPPTAAPNPPTADPVECKDTESQNWCDTKVRNNMCNKAAVAAKCAKTCKICVPPVECADKWKVNKCNRANAKPNLCEKKAWKKNCAKSCSVCGKTTKSPTAYPSADPSASPTDRPSARPTSSPSARPTVSPSASPTATPSENPTATPSEPPSSTPTELKCNLAGKLEFPETAVLGYHASTVRVIKKNWNTMCSNKKRTTNWGCTHAGNAEVGNWEEEGSCNEIETVEIDDAKAGVYEFTLQHIFDDWELYYQGEPNDNDGDDDIVGVLTVSVNGADIGQFNYPKNKGRDTHTTDGLINGEFRGLVFVDVTCDDRCDCTAVKRLPVCPIRAEIRHPPVNVALPGYSNDDISVTKSTQEICSKSSALNEWCVHEGDAEYSVGYEGYDDISRTESILIPEGANSSYTFHIEDGNNYADIEYNNDLAGEVHLFFNYEEKIASYSHWFKDGEKFVSSFYIDVSCDENCKCTVKKRDDVRCRIVAEVEFLEENLKENYGYHKDFMTIQKAGQYELCQWENNNTRTSWGCLHDGNNATVYYQINRKENTTSIESHTESAAIPDATDGEYRFTLEHYTSPLELEYPNDHKLYSTMTIQVNDDVPQGFSYPPNRKTDTHLENGDPNPAYKGKATVDVKCNDVCDCTIEKKALKCEVDAVLSFPENPDYYEYNADLLFVRKEGFGDVCSFYYPSADWGCFHHGDAIIEDVEDDYYYFDVNKAASVNIPDASDSKLEFTVKYYASNEKKSTIYDQSQLNITAGGVSLGTFNHVRNDTEDTHIDGVVNDKYTSDMIVTVACDDSCACTVVPVE